MSYWYLATPYALYPDGKQAAYQAALEQTARFLSAGVPVFSPIVHSHPLSVLLPEHDGSFDFWVKGVDIPMMKAAHGLIVCMLQGWEESKGVAFEISYFENRRPRKPTFYYRPGSPLPLAKLFIAP